MAAQATRRVQSDASATSPSVLLIGLRGSGKSTVGPRVAEALGHQFVDLDLVTMRRLRCATVEEAWREHGIARFREAESEGLRDAVKHPRRVIATGGGTPTAPGAAEAIRKRCEQGDFCVVYLRGAPDALRKRLGVSGDPNRPSLTGGDPVDETDQIYEERDPLYRSLATVVINIDQPLESVVKQTLDAIRAQSA